MALTKAIKNPIERGRLPGGSLKFMSCVLLQTGGTYQERVFGNDSSLKRTLDVGGSFASFKYPR